MIRKNRKSNHTQGAKKEKVSRSGGSRVTRAMPQDEALDDAGARQNMNSFVRCAAVDDIDNLACVMLAADMAPTRH